MKRGKGDKRLDWSKGKEERKWMGKKDIPKYGPIISTDLACIGMIRIWMVVVVVVVVVMRLMEGLT
jgi:hypothetical protein